MNEYSNIRSTESDYQIWLSSVGAITGNGRSSRMKSRTSEFDLAESILLQSLRNPYNIGGVSFHRYRLIHERNEFMLLAAIFMTSLSITNSNESNYPSNIWLPNEYSTIWLFARPLHQITPEKFAVTNPSTSSAYIQRILRTCQGTAVTL